MSKTTLNTPDSVNPDDIRVRRQTAWARQQHNPATERTQLRETWEHITQIYTHTVEPPILPQEIEHVVGLITHPNLSPQDQKEMIEELMAAFAEHNEGCRCGEGEKKAGIADRRGGGAERKKINLLTADRIAESIFSHTTDPQLEDLALRDGAPRPFPYHLAQNPHLSTERLRQLAEHSHAARAGLAMSRHPQMPADVFRTLAEDPNLWWGIICHPNTPADVLEEMYRRIVSGSRKTGGESDDSSENERDADGGDVGNGEREVCGEHLHTLRVGLRKHPNTPNHIRVGVHLGEDQAKTLDWDEERIRVAADLIYEGWEGSPAELQTVVEAA